MSDVVNKIWEEDDVQFAWTLISQYIDSDKEAQELLQEIIKNWVTIRGFSIASTLVETYKQASKQVTAKSTGLRKHLS